MTIPGQDVMDRIERSIAELIVGSNESSASARTGWVFWMALIGFFTVALAGVTHKDLLLETPVDLPLLQVKIPQTALFLFGPLILVLVHLNLLMQHVTLARKLKEVNDRLSRQEGQGHFRQHRLRSSVHSYQFAQAVAGPWRSPVYAFFLHAVNWVTMVVLPLAVLLNFQITYLPFHDSAATFWHRVYTAADAAIILLLGTLILMPDVRFRRATVAAVVTYPVTVLATAATVTLAVGFSLLIATIPDQPIDRFAASLWPVTVEQAAIPEGAPAPPSRIAFAPTAAMFDGVVDDVSGRSTSTFARSLVVINTPLVAPLNPEPDEPSLSLRGRNLRYAAFDRSDMRRVDFSGADLSGASFVQTGLIKARLTRSNLRNADLRGGQLISTIVKGADFEGARLCQEQKLLIFGTSGQDEPKGLVGVPCPR